MKKKIFILIITFILIGELLIRIDKRFNFLEEKRVVKIATSIEITPEYKLLQDTDFIISEKELRIMVLGDSYIFGGGIEFKDNFSQNLKQMINLEKGNFNRGWVLDVARPNANNLDHNLTYFQFVEAYDPNIVIIGYNIDDVNGNLVEVRTYSELDEFNGREMSTKENKNFIKIVYNIIYTSELIHFGLNKLHNELKANGYIIKGSRADLTYQSYLENKENWKKSKELLAEIIEHSEKNNIQLIVYNFPAIHLLEFPTIFTEANKVIRNFFTEHPSVLYVEGSESFRGEKSEKYRLSKYDGHPNEKAHKKIAEEVFDVIKKTNQMYKK